jgi:hypothetical protein
VTFGNQVKSKFEDYGVWGSSRIRDTEIRKKPSQRRCLKSLGWTCELVVAW